MPEPGTLAVFALASLALAVVPGPAVLYIVAQSIHGGRRAGVVSAFGIASGGLVHVLAAVVGLSARPPRRPSPPSRSSAPSTSCGSGSARS
jgi:threonine/homoserine/homoserine lactone efflux protein